MSSMRGLHSFELAALAKELKSIEGFRISRFYETAEARFLMKLRKGDERTALQCILPYFINRTEYVPQGMEPTAFAAAARKRIEGALIESIEQLDGDRIVVIKLRKGEEDYHIVIELFGRGNLIVTDTAMKILLVYSAHNFKDRSVSPGTTYKPPSGARTTPGQGEAEPEGLEPTLYVKDGVAVDFSLRPEDKYKSLEARRFESVQDLLGAYYGMQAPAEAKKSKEVEALEKSMSRQKALIASLDKEITDCKMEADAVMRNLHGINALISFLKQNRHATKADAQGAAEGIKILDVNLKEKTVRIEME